MLKSRLATIAFAAALLVSNISCACSLSAATMNPDGSSGNEGGAHHHTAEVDSTASATCAHDDCEGCDELRDVCASPEHVAFSTERDTRVFGYNAPDFDSSDLDLIHTGVDPPPAVSIARLHRLMDGPDAHLLYDTPVDRKDQLIE